MQTDSTSLLSLDAKSRLLQIQRAARDLRQTSLSSKNQVLEKVVSLLSLNESKILSANQKDLQNLEPGTSAAFRDRLKLSPERLQQMRQSLNEIIALPDPIGEIPETKQLQNGLLLKQVRAPLGVILMIFEARPNVITEAFSLAFKAGNTLILRGGSESLQTSALLYQLIESALESVSLSKNIFWGITDPSRDLVQALMKQNKMIDVLVPRGGDSLIDYVTQNSTIPLIKNDRGMCHVYIHEDASVDMAIEIILNSKTQRPGVCNAMETLLIHESKISVLPQIYAKLENFMVEWFGCPQTLKVLQGKAHVQPALAQSFDTEYLDLKMNCRVVPSLNEAIEHIEIHGSKHSECIVTASEKSARLFQNSIDAAVIYWNASTRFTDGYQFGLGGELGISTQKLHVRGPVGLKQLTSLRWMADGTGQVRS